MVPSALLFKQPRKSLVLDLDETLVHSQFKMTDSCDLKLYVTIDNYHGNEHVTNTNNISNKYNNNPLISSSSSTTTTTTTSTTTNSSDTTIFYVAKRPYLDLFLRTVSKWYDIIIFTASLQKCGDPLISILDEDHVVKRRIFRQHCVRKNGNFIKDLIIVNPNLSNVITIDNNPTAYSIQPSNAIPIQPRHTNIQRAHDENRRFVVSVPDDHVPRVIVRVSSGCQSVDGSRCARAHREGHERVRGSGSRIGNQPCQAGEYPREDRVVALYERSVRYRAMGT